MEQQVQQRQQEDSRLEESSRQLETRLQEVKAQLEELREDWRALSLEGLSLRSDRNYFDKELVFLQRLEKEEGHSLQVFCRSNQFIEKSSRDIGAHIEVLKQQRKVILQQVSKEEDLVRQGERHNAEMSNRLERMGRERIAVAAERQEKHLQDLKVREMQGETPPPPILEDRYNRSPQCHSWAPSVTSGGKVHSAPNSPISPVRGGHFGSSYPRLVMLSAKRSKEVSVPPSLRSREGV